MSHDNGTLNLRVARIEVVTPEIKRFTLVSPTGAHLPAFSGGSHVVVLIASAHNTLRNPYSLLSSPYDTSSYQIAVRRVDSGRGGSTSLHDTVTEGDLIQVTPPVNLFALIKQARLHLFIAGGVGITPVISQLEELQLSKVPFELHYAVRGEEHAQLGKELQATYGEQVHLYRKGIEPRMDIGQVLADRPLGSHVYVCGPDSMIDASLRCARDLGWTDSHVHFERFLEQSNGGEAFSFTLGRSGTTIEVSPDQTMLEAVEAAGHTLPYLCRGGACGHCETNVLELDGELLHSDDWLSDEDKTSGKKIMPCVSRAKCNRLVIDL
ncbi:MULTISPECIES: PDR/VanB family oxidoreductase [unclassified Pseudomonas]|uniref:PDR/VanB family oxidoreductase n=1 Tax=unclassified Pseudomonas TaxID=196821 RepID=UPI0015A154D7|nr:MULTISPECIES: PDR/VanB family oxidoreductase [unclassified Pseudomonas]NWC93815.1 oxidoreductase [Pseudomonas sp. IPO3779]NWD16211.1 oxidoreductase [Pseudomonas sp. IPO3778]